MSDLLAQPTFGRVGHLTPDQQTSLDEFKADLVSAGLFSESRHDDYTLLRFLRARKFVLPAARKMIEDYEKWRVDFEVDKLNLEFDFPEYPVVMKYYPRYYHKCDKMGRPVYIEQLGMLDIKQLFAVTTMDRMLQHHVFEYEKLVNYRLKACSIAKNTHLEQSTTILDMKGVSLSSFSQVFSMVKQVSTIAQNYYPEMLGKMFIINAPMLFTGVWQLIKPLLDEATVKKIDIIGSSYTAKLLEMIDEDSLPVFLGGKSTGGNDCGPWNDGSVEGYPKKEFEKLNEAFGDMK